MFYNRHTYRVQFSMHAYVTAEVSVSAMCVTLADVNTFVVGYAPKWNDIIVY